MRPVRTGGTGIRTRALAVVAGVVPAVALAALATVPLVPIAAADTPTKATEPFSFAATFPAGDVCSFDYGFTVSGTDELTLFTDGRVQVHTKYTVVHTNLDSNDTLTESDQLNSTFEADGSTRQVGRLFHVVDASGKLVVSEGGQILFDPAGDVIKTTAGISPDFFAVICQALGGTRA